MAAVDKIYVTNDQFIKLKQWYDTMKEEGLMPDYIPFNQYNFDVNDLPHGDFPVWNLSVKADMWLLSNCPFDFVKGAIMNNYNW